MPIKYIEKKGACEINKSREINTGFFFSEQMFNVQWIPREAESLSCTFVSKHAEAEIILLTVGNEDSLQNGLHYPAVHIDGG